MIRWFSRTNKGIGLMWIKRQILVLVQFYVVCLSERLHVRMEFSDDEEFIFTQESSKSFEDTQSASYGDHIHGISSEIVSLGNNYEEYSDVINADLTGDGEPKFEDVVCRWIFSVVILFC